MSDAEQGSAEWLFERCGFITASRFEDVIGRTKTGKYRAERENYLWELAVERITGQPSDHWTSTAMLWGRDQEHASRMRYEAATGHMLEAVGFVKHPAMKLVGASPDALIGDDGGFESKSPWKPENHLKWLLAGGVPEEHVAQCQGGMWVTGRQWWDFQSWDPRLPDGLNRFCRRVERDDTYIRMLEAEIKVFADELDARVREILKAGGQS